METEAAPELRIDNRLFVWVYVGVVLIVVALLIGFPFSELAEAMPNAKRRLWLLQVSGAVLLVGAAVVIVRWPTMVELGDRVVVRRLLSRRVYEWPEVRRLRVDKPSSYWRLTVELDGGASASCTVSAKEADQVRALAAQRGLPALD